MPIPSTPSIMPNVLGYAADTVQIPETTPTGQGIPSFRDLFPFITQVDPDAGGVMVERAWMNALFNLLGQHAFFQQSGCVYPWQATLDYVAGCHVLGSDDVEYIACSRLDLTYPQEQRIPFRKRTVRTGFLLNLLFLGISFRIRVGSSLVRGSLEEAV